MMTVNQLHPKPTQYQRTLAVSTRGTSVPQSHNAGSTGLNSSRRAASPPTLAVRSSNNIKP